LGKETSLLNDTHSALMADATFGIVQGMKNVILITPGTIGGGG
jgi:glucokinase